MAGTFEDSLCTSIENPNMLKRGQQIDKGVYILGAVRQRKLDDIYLNALTSYLGAMPFNDTILSFISLELKQYLIYRIKYSKMIKRDNSTVLYEAESYTRFCQVWFFFGEIERDDDIEIVAFVKELRCPRFRADTNILKVLKTNVIKVIPVKKIISSYIFVDLPQTDSCFVSLFPNKLESD